MNIRGLRELTTGVIERGMCIACSACASICPYLRTYLGKTAVLFPCDCPQGRCYAYCPKIEVDLDECSHRMYGEAYSPKPIGTYRAIYESRAGAATPASSFQAGGTVTSILGSELARGSIDAAVCTGRNGIRPEPRIASTFPGVSACAGSTYVVSPVIESYHKARAQGYSRLAITVLPCQALSCALIRSNPLEDPGYPVGPSLVIGLFCTWSLDLRQFQELVRKRVDEDAIRKFDIPPPPAERFEIHTGSGRIDIPLSEVRSCIPRACAYCFDMTAEFADISVGLVEGRAGRNILVVRTERGEEAVNAAVEKGFLEVSPLEESIRKGLFAAAASKKRRAFSQCLSEGMINCEGETSSYLRVNSETLNAIIV